MKLQWFFYSAAACQLGPLNKQLMHGQNSVLNMNGALPEPRQLSVDISAETEGIFLQFEFSETDQVSLVVRGHFSETKE